MRSVQKISFPVESVLSARRYSSPCPMQPHRRSTYATHQTDPRASSCSSLSNFSMHSSHQLFQSGVCFTGSLPPGWNLLRWPSNGELRSPRRCWNLSSPDMQKHWRHRQAGKHSWWCTTSTVYVPSNCANQRPFSESTIKASRQDNPFRSATLLRQSPDVSGPTAVRSGESFPHGT